MSAVAERFVRVPRPPILSEIDPLAHGVVEASAGTGKTFLLEHLVIDLVLRHGLSIEQVLVVTFTDKATREMRERLRERLRTILEAVSEADRDRQHEDGPDHAGGVAEHGGSTGELASGADPAWWWIDDAGRRRLEDALASFDRAPISTIHAFCQRVLAERAFECARLLSQEQVESRSAFGRGFREELRVSLAERSQSAAVLERALADVGPDRLEAALYRWYTEPGVPEPRFDPSLAEDSLRRLPTRAELSSGGRVSRLLASGLSRNPKVMVPRRLMAVAPLVEAVRGGRSIFDVLLPLWDWAREPVTTSHHTLGYLCHHLGKSASRELRPLAALLRQLQAAAGGPLSVLVGELLPRILLRITDHKADHGQLDFDDMLRMLRDALCRPEGDSLVRALAARYRVALVDEFQDTDRVQWDIFRRLFVETPGSLVVIGDPKQAIYGFRNADVHTYHQARAHLVARGARAVPLTVNYRSAPAVVDALNHVFEGGFFSGLNRYEHPVRAGRGGLRAVGEGDVAPITLFHLVGRPKLDTAGARRVLAERIAGEVRRVLEGAIQVEEDGARRRIGPSDIQVLCRSRADADAVSNALDAARIPFAVYKQEGLFQTDAARHLWELLRAVEAPRDPVRRMHAWLTPFFSVPLGRLADAREVGPEHPLVAQLTAWHQLAHRQRWAQLFRSILVDSGLGRRALFAGLGERDLTDYVHLLELLLEEVHRGHRSIAQLRTRLASFIEGRELPVGDAENLHRVPSEEAAVQVLTMHKSKGLEADVVFLAGGFSEPLPNRLDPRVFHDAEGQRVAWMGELTDEVRERMARERREEAERLLYVALTRARVKLYVPYVGEPPPSKPFDEALAVRLEDPSVAEVAGEVSSPRSLGGEDPDGAEALPDLHLRAMSGPYRVLNERLEALVRAGQVPGPWLEHEVVVVKPRPRARRQLTVDRTRSRPASFDQTPLPNPGQWEQVPTDAPIEPGGWVARVPRGPEVTSYTAMKRAAARSVGARSPSTGASLAAAGVGQEAAAATGDDAAARAHRVDLDVVILGTNTGPVQGDGAPEPPEDELPGGASVGVFLHEVLEHLPFDEIELLPAAPAAPWYAEHRALFERCARQNGIDRDVIPRAAGLLRAAMSARVELADGSVLPDGLRGLTRRAAEYPFVHPIPEVHHPRLGASPAARGADRPALRIERGYVRGVIDLLFEHEGRYHVLDYKSDRLPDYAPASVQAHVDEHYRVQLRLYALGALRALGIHDEEAYARRFGGLVYAFLRGMEGESGAGIVTVRPRFEEVLAWEAALLGDEAWGYPLPARTSLPALQVADPD